MQSAILPLFSSTTFPLSVRFVLTLSPAMKEHCKEWNQCHMSVSFAWTRSLTYCVCKKESSSTVEYFEMHISANISRSKIESLRSNTFGLESMRYRHWLAPASIIAMRFARSFAISSSKRHVCQRPRKIKCRSAIYHRKRSQKEMSRNGTAIKSG